MLYREVAVTEAVDLVFLNVAAHATDELSETPALPQAIALALLSG